MGSMGVTQKSRAQEASFRSKVGVEKKVSRDQGITHRIASDTSLGRLGSLVKPSQ